MFFLDRTGTKTRLVGDQRGPVLHFRFTENIAPKIFREEHKEEGKERRIECGSDRAIYKLFVLSFLCPIGELIVTLGCA